MTAGVIGANIGGGLVLLAALPATAVTALAIVLILMAHRRAARETVARLPARARRDPTASAHHDLSPGRAQ